MKDKAITCGHCACACMFQDSAPVQTLEKEKGILKKSESEALLIQNIKYYFHPSCKNICMQGKREEERMKVLPHTHIR